MNRYRPAPEEEGSSDNASSPKKTKSEKPGKGQSKKKDELWTGKNGDLCKYRIIVHIDFLNVPLIIVIFLYYTIAH